MSEEFHKYKAADDDLMQMIQKHERYISQQRERHSLKRRRMRTCSLPRHTGVVLPLFLASFSGESISRNCVDNRFNRESRNGADSRFSDASRVAPAAATAISWVGFDTSSARLGRRLFGILVGRQTACAYCGTAGCSDCGKTYCGTCALDF